MLIMISGLMTGSLQCLLMIALILAGGHALRQS